MIDEIIVYVFCAAGAVVMGMVIEVWNTRQGPYSRVPRGPKRRRVNRQ